jgi:ABC-2 type transport system permease protein
MRKLLRANFSRLWSDKIFLLSAAIMFVMGAALPVIHYMDNLNNDAGWTPDSTTFAFAFFVPILLSLMTALFVGCEYSDGTMRNKLIVGHRRSNIYLANLIVCIVAGGLLCIAYLLPHTCLALALLGSFEAKLQTVLLYAGLIFALIIAFSALFVLIAMLCQSKAHTVAGCILLVFALLFAGIRITATLNEPEYFQAYSYTENGVTVSEDAERNPNYPTGTKRQIYEFLQDFTPGGQVIQLANMDTESPALLTLYNGIILFAATGCGLIVFRRKDLK